MCISICCGKYYIFSASTIETLAKLKGSPPLEAHSTCTYSKCVRRIVNSIETKWNGTRQLKHERKRAKDCQNWPLWKKGLFGLFCVARNRNIEHLYTLRVTNIQFSLTLFNQTQRSWEKRKCWASGKGLVCFTNFPYSIVTASSKQVKQRTLTHENRAPGQEERMSLEVSKNSVKHFYCYTFWLNSISRATFYTNQVTQYRPSHDYMHLSLGVPIS